MSARRLLEYCLRYTSAYVIASLAIVAVVYLFQLVSIDLGSGTGMNFAIGMAGALYPLINFMEHNDRLPNAAEYWTLVLVFTVLGTALEALKLAMATAAFPEFFTNREASIFAIELAAGYIFVTNLIVLSQLFAGPQLKHIRKKRLEKA